MSHEDWLERSDIYAVGALDGEELTEFERHLKTGCPLCEQHLRDTHDALALLPRSLPQMTPPPTIKARLLEQIGVELSPVAAAPQTRLIGWVVWGTALVSACFIIVLQHGLLSNKGRELERLTGMVVDLKTDLTREEAVRQLLAEPDARLIELGGLPASPEASGRLLWNPTSRTGLLLTKKLPIAPEGKVYELWAITGNDPQPAGLFTVDERGNGTLKLPPLADPRAVEAFAVTLEPSGGVPKPTGPMHLLGKL